MSSLLRSDFGHPEDSTSIIIHLAQSYMAIYTGIRELTS